MLNFGKNNKIKQFQIYKLDNWFLRGSISDLLDSVLPEISPHLFPDIQNSKWIHRADYELSQILELEKKKELATAEFKQKMSKIDKRIQDERNENSWRHELISETNDVLVKAVQRALRILGFLDIVDMDIEYESKNETRKEDLQIRDGKKVIVVDIKGISGLPSDEDVMQAQKHAILLNNKNKDTDKETYSLSIVNHQRHLPPLDRNNKEPFGSKILGFSEDVTGLLTTWELFNLVRNFEKLEWSKDNITPLFYKTGRIKLIPCNYYFLGNISNIWKNNNAFGINMVNEALSAGDRIAIKTISSEVFQEIAVSSIMVNDKNTESVNSGNDVGISCEDISSIKRGMEVFLIK